MSTTDLVQVEPLLPMSPDVAREAMTKYRELTAAMLTDADLDVIPNLSVKRLVPEDRVGYRGLDRHRQRVDRTRRARPADQGARRRARDAPERALCGRLGTLLDRRVALQDAERAREGRERHLGHGGDAGDEPRDLEPRLISAPGRPKRSTWPPADAPGLLYASNGDAASDANCRRADRAALPDRRARSSRSSTASSAPTICRRSQRAWCTRSSGRSATSACDDSRRRPRTRRPTIRAARTTRDVVSPADINYDLLRPDVASRPMGCTRPTSQSRSCSISRPARGSSPSGRERRLPYYCRPLLICAEPHAHADVSTTLIDRKTITDDDAFEAALANVHRRDLRRGRTAVRIGLNTFVEARATLSTSNMPRDVAPSQQQSDIPADTSGLPEPTPVGAYQLPDADDVPF